MRDPARFESHNPAKILARTKPQSRTILPVRDFVRDLARLKDRTVRFLQGRRLVAMLSADFRRGCSLPLHSVLGVLKQAILANRAGDLTGALPQASTMRPLVRPRASFLKLLVAGFSWFLCCLCSWLFLRLLLKSFD